MSTAPKHTWSITLKSGNMKCSVCGLIRNTLWWPKISKPDVLYKRGNVVITDDLGFYVRKVPPCTPVVKPPPP